MKNKLEFMIYSTPEEDIRIDAAVKEETIWLTQKVISDFDKALRKLTEQHDVL